MNYFGLLEGFNNLMFYCLNQDPYSNLVIVLKNLNLINVDCGVDMLTLNEEMLRI